MTRRGRTGRTTARSPQAVGVQPTTSVPRPVGPPGVQPSRQGTAISSRPASRHTCSTRRSGAGSPAPGARRTDRAVGLPSLLDSPDSRAGGWLLDHYQVSTRMAVEPGVRVDWSSVARGDRLAAVLGERRACGGIRARARRRLFTQSPGYEKLLQADNFVDLSSPTAAGEERTRGACARRSSGISRRAAGPRRGVLQVVRPADRRERSRPGETAARVAQYDFPADVALERALGAADHQHPINGGTGRAYGFDVYVAHERRPRGGRAGRPTRGATRTSTPTGAAIPSTTTGDMQ